MMRLLLLISLAVMVMAAPAAAQIWNEQGDAGDLPVNAQTPAGSGPLTTINGNLTTGDADMYCITIDDVATFRATTCNTTTIDTQLWLFDMSGIGISFDDDDPGGCGLQSTLTGAYVPATGPYLIAISQYNWDAKNASGLDIWESSPFNVERPPDGPGAPGPVASWGTSPPSGGAYSIALTGVVFCGGATPVEETTWGLIKSQF